MDAYAHVNNVRFIHFFESARIAYFDALSRALPPGGSVEPMPGTFLSGRSSCGPILAATSCRFRAPLTFPDALAVGARVTAIDAPNGRFTLTHGIWSHKGSVLAAEGTGDVVVYDYVRGAKAAGGIPSELLAAIATVEARAGSRTEESIFALAAHDANAMLY